MFTLVIWKPDVVIALTFPSGYVTVTSPVCSVAYMVSFFLWYNTVVSLTSTQTHVQ